MMRKTFLTSALDMPEIMSYIYNKSWKLQFSASSSIIIIEDFYLQTFLHSLENLYSVRCLLVHNMYILNEESHKLLRELDNAFIDVLMDMLLTFDTKRGKVDIEQ